MRLVPPVLSTDPARSRTAHRHPHPLRTLIVRLISTAQTGFFYTTQRLRQGPKLSAVKYDPRGASLSPVAADSMGCC